MIAMQGRFAAVAQADEHSRPTTQQGPANDEEGEMELGL